jgi:hypothetical protein
MSRRVEWVERKLIILPDGSLADAVATSYALEAELHPLAEIEFIAQQLHESLSRFYRVIRNEFDRPVLRAAVNLSTDAVANAISQCKDGSWPSLQRATRLALASSQNTTARRLVRMSKAIFIKLPTRIRWLPAERGSGAQKGVRTRCPLRGFFVLHLIVQAGPWHIVTTLGDTDPVRVDLIGDEVLDLAFSPRGAAQLAAQKTTAAIFVRSTRWVRAVAKSAR